MNDLTVFIYLIFFVALFGATFAFMFKSMTDIQREMDRSPTRSYADAMRAYTPKKIVTRMPHQELDRVDEYDDEFLVKMKLEVIVEDEDAEKVTEAIKKAAYSGKIGDGKIFIYNIDQVIRIRTGEKDSDAV